MNDLYDEFFNLDQLVPLFVYVSFLPFYVGPIFFIFAWNPSFDYLCRLSHQYDSMLINDHKGMS